MTPTQRRAMEMALEALGNTWTEPGNVQYNTETAAMQALRAALAERQPLFKPLIDQLPGLAEELAEQDDAVKAAWLAGYTEGEKAAWAGQDADKADAEDAKRYNWIRSRKGLSLQSDCTTWTRPDGTKFTASHYLAEGGTQHAPAASLDETIDAAMRVRETPNEQGQPGRE